MTLNPSSTSGKPPKMGLVIPYRNREAHLKEFIPYLTKFLKDIPFHLFIIEQSPEKGFNNGALLNIGYLYSKSSCDYLCFHCVDMLPVSADYSYPTSPTRVASQIEQYNFGIPYPTYFGGVVLFNYSDFEKVNGYSNQYWGWGYEDEDMSNRIEKSGLQLTSRPGMFLSLPHQRADENSPSVALNRKRCSALILDYLSLEEDGLNTMKYKVISEKHDKQISHILVDL